MVSGPGLELHILISKLQTTKHELIMASTVAKIYKTPPTPRTSSSTFNSSIK